MLAALLLAALPVVALAVLIALRSPVGALVAAYAAIVPLGSAVDLPLPLPPPFDTLSSITGGLASIAMLVHLLLVRRGAERLSASMPVWLLFVGLAGVTFAWSIDPTATTKDVFLLVSVVSLFVLTGLMPISRAEVERIGTAIVGGATVASLLGVALFLTGRAPVGKSGTPRFLITGDDPNHTAAGLVLPLIVALSRGMDSGRRPEIRLGYGMAAALMGTGIVLTGSRGGLSAMAVGVLALALQSGSARRVAAVMAIVAAGGMLALTLAPAALEDRLVSRSSTGRTDIWRLGFSACSEHCLRGSGWGTFPSVYQQQFRTHPTAGGYRTQGFRAHNIWLQALIELGILGLVLLVAAYATTASELRRLPRADRGPPLAALIGMALASSLVSNLTFKYFWLVMMYAVLTINARGAAAEVATGRGRVDTISGTLVGSR